MRSLLIALAFASCVEWEISDPPDAATPVPNAPDIIADPVEDVIQQPERNKVDVLWVIDNSGSMEQEQQALILSFESFIQYFIDSDLDWHIGVTSTDMSPGPDPGIGGKLRRSGGRVYIDGDTPNPIGVFSDMAAMGTTGSGTEEGIAATWSALTKHRSCEHNFGFYREDAKLVVIVISDENDHSESPKWSEWVPGILSLKSKPDEVAFHAIVCTSPGPINGIGCGPPYFGDESVGYLYMDSAAALNGSVWDIRQKNWDPFMSELGLLSIVRRQEFFLSSVPVVESLAVWVENGDWTYTFKLDVDFGYDPARNSIYFYNILPPEGSRIHIQYIPRSETSNLEKDTWNY